VRDHDNKFSDLNGKISNLQDSFERSKESLRQEISKERENKSSLDNRSDNRYESRTDNRSENRSDRTNSNPTPAASTTNSSTPRSRTTELPPVTAKPTPAPASTPSETDKSRLARVNSTPMAGEGKDIKERSSFSAMASKSDTTVAPPASISSSSTSARDASGGGFEKGIVWCYDAATEEWCRGMIMFKMDKAPFAEGALRAAYKVDVKDKVTGCDSPPDPAVAADKLFKVGALPTGLNQQSDKYVLKLSKKPVPVERYFEDVKMQAICAEFGSKFNLRQMPKPVQFLQAWVLEMPRNPSVYCGLEPFIEGEFIKLNSNYGAVLSDRNTPQAFSHFTWEQSNHSLLVVDLQGVKDFYTDPQIHTKDGKGFGLGNLGMNGIDRFLKTHKCNAICQMLVLPMINIATDASKKKVAMMKGTMKVPFIEDALTFGNNPRWEGPTNFSNGEFQCAATLSGHSDRVMSLWIGPKQLYSGTGDGEIKVWNHSNYTLETTINAHRKSVESMCGNEKYLFSCSTDHSIKVWDLEKNFELVAPLRDHVGEVYAITLTDKTLGFLISASFDKTIKVWNLRTWKCQQTLEGHTKAIKALAVSGSILFSGSNDGTIMVWNLKYMSCIFTIDGHEGWVKALAVKDRSLYSASFDYLIKEWDITSFNLNATLTEHNDDLFSLWATDKFLISACNDRSIILWDYNTKKPLATIKGHRSGVQAVVADGTRIFSGSDDYTVKVWKWEGK